MIKILKLSHIIKSIHFNRHFPRLYSSNSDQNHIRNIGILAHIDAGKTTTTERMLFYAGKTNSLGEVHHGNTVTDYLSQERERGITICSSAVTFPWKDYRFNLLDTPGHIDFTMEVEQSLGAVDGTIIILDATAGVEAQTVTVWQQANHHKLPRLVFANKMDRPDADFERCVNDLKQKLGVIPVALQFPYYNNLNKFAGIIDIIHLKILEFDSSKEGRAIKIIPLTDPDLEYYKQKRFDLIDFLSGLDDQLAEQIINENSLDIIENEMIIAAIRRCTINHQIVPILLGSAYKNTGIQPLMDAVIKFLPTPLENEKNKIYNCFGKDFAGKVFKVVHDTQRGPLSMVRILRGALRKGMKITNSNSSAEQLQRIYEPLADEYREVTEITAGDVGVCAGLKNTSTGDLVVSSMASLKVALKSLKKIKNKTEKNLDDDDENESPEVVAEMFGLRQKIPDAVYFCSIEPPTLSQQLPLEVALKQLQREDPSLRVKYDETTLQTVLGGMGELHLDIIKSRILSDYKIDVDLGPLHIAYKETVANDRSRDTYSIEKIIGGDKQYVSIDMSLVKDSTVAFKLDQSPEAIQNISLIRPRLLNTFKKGVVASLERGPRLGGEIINTQIILHRLDVGRGTADSFIMAAAGQCVQKILLSHGCRLLEPVMALEIITSIDRVSTILADLSRRRSTILDVQPRGDNKIIHILAPLAELSGYSSVLRTISSGRANMSMQPYGYTLMESHEEESAIRRAQGLE